MVSGSQVVNDVNKASYSQTYMQASNSQTNTTDSKANPEQQVPKEKSNVDLLSDLDITINQAPLVPQVSLTEKVLKENDEKEEKHETPISSENVEFSGKEEKTDDAKASRLDDKNENLQIVWDTWYIDVQPKKDPLGDPHLLQKFIIDIEKYEKFVDSLLVKTLSGATNLDIKWKEVQDLEVSHE